MAHSPFRVFTAKELEEDPLVNYIDDYISNNQEGFNDEKSMQEDQFSLSENDEKPAQIQNSLRQNSFKNGYGLKYNNSHHEK